VQFTHDWLPQRVRFATGGAAEVLAEEIRRLEASRVMVIATDAARVEPVLTGVSVAVLHTDVAMHVPVEVAEHARRVAAEHAVDALVCFGGGSTTGLAKAVALTSALPILAVPTTYSGSEATNVWGLTESGRKTTGVDPAVLPRVVVYDASLTVDLPVPTTVVSGLNALAHCVDSMWAPRCDRIDQLLAVDGIHALRDALPRVAREPRHLPGREELLYGSYVAAVAFASAGSGLHHKVCHVLGGMFDLPHAETHAVVLPHVVALNSSRVPDLDHRMATAFGSRSALAGVLALRDGLGAPRSLRELGMSEDDVPRAVGPVLEAAPPDNPMPLTPENVEALLRAAWAGKEPG
jgi:alcohol dehydrogenase class IV